MRTHVSAALPNAFANRRAISALMPDFPVIILERVCRVTPRTFAPSVTDKPKGSRQALFTMRPGCAGFFIGISSPSLVVVDQFNVNAPRAALDARSVAPWRLGVLYPVASSQGRRL